MADRRQTFPYKAMLQDALRGVLRQVLTVTAADGLPGAHHFYITFRTRHPGVEISDYLLQRHPEEMTIVLQNQFWGLEVAEDHFEVTLSFNKVNERLHVPFRAVASFADPSARFGLQFEIEAPADEPAGTPAFDAPDDSEDDETPAFARARSGSKRTPFAAAKPGKPARPGKSGDGGGAGGAGATPPSGGTAGTAGTGGDGAKVVTLDAFRKK
ncbi:MAG: ClpXP protease specificity-enhancing factor SspB [Alphaproteobacteria bacterium]